MTPYSQFVSEEKQEILNYLTHISSPRGGGDANHVALHNGNRRNDDDLIPNGNAKQLQAIGNIGLHLSDFETEVCVHIKSFCLQWNKIFCDQKNRFLLTYSIHSYFYCLL